METTEKQQFEVLYTQYLEWKTGQISQTDGYEFERSFHEFCQIFNAKLFELSVSSESSKKKGHIKLRGGLGSKRPLFEPRRKKRLSSE